MNIQTLLGTLAAATLCSTAHAAITSAQWQSSSGAVVSYPGNWNSAGATLSTTGVQNGSPASMVGSVSTDTAEDPILTLDSALNNDTGFSWAAYQVNVYMGETFTLSSVDVTVPTGWGVSLVQQPTFSGGQYEGTMLFSGVAPIAPGQSLDFGYQMAFNGGFDIEFSQEMIPIAVPEPGLFGLIGGLALCAFAVGSRFRGWHSAGVGM